MRLVTRGDMDGLTSAVLITSLEQIDAIELIHPQDITDKRFRARPGDIVVNLPWVDGCLRWFDHHQLTDSNARPPEGFDGRMDPGAPSAARLVFEYYNHPELARFEELLRETDRLDSSNLTPADILDPQRYILLGHTIDSRTGLGHFKEYFLHLVDWLKTLPIEDILQQPEVRQRIHRMQEEDAQFRAALLECSREEGPVVVTDFRGLDKIPVGNRFLVYTLFPRVNVSLRVHWGPRRQFLVIVAGHNIFNRTCEVNIGELMSRFGGGGHRGAGAAPIPPDRVDRALAEMIEILK